MQTNSKLVSYHPKITTPSTQEDGAGPWFHPGIRPGISAARMESVLRCWSWAWLAPEILREEGDGGRPAGTNEAEGRHALHHGIRKFATTHVYVAMATADRSWKVYQQRARFTRSRTHTLPPLWKGRRSPARGQPGSTG
jgi:hypothetical protein